jgi:hypothetical protein
MRKVVITTLALVLLLSVLAYGCAKPAPSPTSTPAPEAPKTLDIGIITP